MYVITALPEFRSRLTCFNKEGVQLWYLEASDKFIQDIASERSSSDFRD